MMLARAQAANGHDAEAAKTTDRAIAHATAKPLDVHVVGRQLLADGKKQEALRVFEANAKRFPDQWPVHVGLMRGYAAVGRNKEALTEARQAVRQAPDEPNRNLLQKAIKSLEAGKGID
jgi:Flp pilus assembly protein TadD